MKKISILAVLTILTATLFSTSSLAQISSGKANVWNNSTASTTTDGTVLIRDNTSQGFNGKLTIQNSLNDRGVSIISNIIAKGGFSSVFGMTINTTTTSEDLFTTGLENNVSSAGQTYGFSNYVNTSSTFEPVYGIYSSVSAPKGNQNVYGIYSRADAGYAGYFQGNALVSGTLTSGALTLTGPLSFKNSTSSIYLNYSTTSLDFGALFRMLSTGAFEFGSINNKFTMGTALENSLKTLTITPGNQKFYSNGSAFIPGGVKFAVTSGMLIKQTTTASGKQAITIAPGGFMFRNDGNMEVHGTIYAKEVLVSMPPFPDYVFEKDYSMMSLDQLEKYIASNGHLPNVPSATEIEENGIGLGELSTIQMEKIEEISLYLIELNNKIKALELENQELKAALKKAE